MRTHLIIAGLLTLVSLTQPAHAEARILFANCGDAGCACKLSITMSEYEALVGSPAPPGAENMVLVEKDNDYIWSSASVEEVDASYGGDGVCPIEVFTIIPEDGAWRGSVRVQEIKGCLPQVADMVPPLVDAMGSVKQITWGGKFHPGKFALSTAPDGIRWTERSPTQFDGVFPVPANGTLDVKVTATATLTAPDRAEATMALRLAAASKKDAAALALLGMADCKVDAVYDFERVAP
ncbi:hypothetical protein [Cypionkella sinensis]|uniref:Uncharacterized protein n=1 Tax=Cypionkella sinensis TaxID=1756043 RepID=A0ABV7J528_9RHOB